MQQFDQDSLFFNTQLPYIHNTDTIVNDSLYIDYLYDSQNIQKTDSTFLFELKEIVLPEMADTTINKIVYDKPSIFFPYKSQPVILKPSIRKEVNNDWLTGIFILSLLILTWIRYEGEKRLSQLFKAILGRHNMNQLLRDGDVIHERITPGLMFIYTISIATLISFVIQPYEIEIPGADNAFLLFAFLAGVILIFWFIKIGFIRISGKIFRMKSESDEYLITNIIYNVCTGLIAFPFVFAAHYADNRLSILIAAGIFCIGAVLRFVRSIFIGLSAQSFPVFYIFLYLCTLEILPFLVMYKLFINQ